MRTCAKTLLLGTVLILAAVLSPAAAQNVKTAQGQLTVGIHKYKAQAGEFYYVTVKGNGFEPKVEQRPDFLRYVRRDFDKRYEYKGYLVPRRTEEQTIFIAPQLYNLKGTGPFSYTVEVKRVPFSEKLLLDVKGAWVATDPLYKPETDSHFKAYKIQLQSGKFYTIELKRIGISVDPLLFLEDPKGKIITSDDDGAGGRDSLIVITPKQSGHHRIVATTLSKATGQYTLKVRTQK